MTDRIQIVWTLKVGSLLRQIPGQPDTDAVIKAGMFKVGQQYTFQVARGADTDRPLLVSAPTDSL